MNGYRYFYAIPLKQSEVNWTFPWKHEGGRQKSRELIFFQIFLAVGKTGQRRKKNTERMRNGKKRESSQGKSSQAKQSTDTGQGDSKKGDFAGHQGQGIFKR